MAYQRKTQDEYHILVNYGQGWENETIETTFKALKENLTLYKANCGYPVKWKKVRVKIQVTNPA